MKLIIGLGNPGEKYENTRHSVGYMVVDALLEKLQNSITPSNFKLNKKFKSLVISYQSSVVLAKPTTFMNSSGIAVRKLVNHFKINMADVWIIHDDLDLSLGSYKIQKGKGPREHNGLLSIYEKLGTKNFWHVRIGIENRGKGSGEPSFAKAMEGKEYVLRNFNEEEKSKIDVVVDSAVKDLIHRFTN
ncbi:aminoacyl-tRNA hydrolase [Candidatus Woesebacteria bacterium RIFCSPLOWO2_01_FULL_39_23]|uniref:Peptidyl-tRNA hydrolase n=1 Tax=Candidatus Woesebacteria bacterium RIFCSPHIGHO2_01_FULL_40_22 TaxID=1802499 RepID=A0A1F7YKP8_9BACT|nr:MAG: aminoacyl-tRNA hydrolase [Candidatus Woesebacteria bacterium RBG_16_40_11]OGM27168.1 MAG: aminoacyl-tRNA hydrolase [Candidatus Woesebacteria bacterium RIFCSPHIGHO2_01_FULL_40_22]OGM36905.1 MAG: aminoacyl-tRNA hydrolase [Candidatus Woesebacteria bacterium RIFCSPHIGHO2_12_FULL_38_9]OGM63334.1 MAG: aminoacyl-tRNA hydrolase [Candidatus Woesebacteria bacterium RIFCSPLOWO2_01_FULL_39_23]